MTFIRTTHFSRLNSLTNQNSRLAAKMGKAAEIASTGMKYTRPSDDPGRVGVIHSVREQLKDQDVWTGNSEWAETIMVLADNALSNMTDVMASVKELAVQMSSEYYEGQGMTNAISEATAWLESLVHHGNIDIGGRFIFAGASYDSEAFDSTGTYQGDTDEPEIPVGESLDVAGGFDGSRLLQGTTDVFQVVNDLITALGTNDSNNVADLLDDIDAAQTQLISAQSEVGAEMLKVDDALELAQSLGVELQLTLAGLTEADQVESYANLLEYQTAYEAALQVTVASQVSNLFSKI